MKLTAILAAAALLTMFSGSGLADDHFFQAADAGGLLFDEDLDTTTTRNGHVLPESPGQGSPFSGEHQCTPATDTEAAQDHANVMAKGADDIEECREE
jgi:hypothetical protein